ncbi:hypothetical protein [Streptomyces sp. NBC_01217]|uniref:hypothetical protein n=1 Tax=Streptomyces sp. NBC_01217 TaxID=2903779 RepID=UPI002E0F5389|nr:hypothetical protein OG507_20730 [Streptomyces sp. NBC_01217]
MRTYIGGQEAVNVIEFEELAYGFDAALPDDFRELFLLGTPSESADERAARLAVAGEVLAELQEAAKTDAIAGENARYAEALTSVVPLRNKLRTMRAVARMRTAA